MFTIAKIANLNIAVLSDLWLYVPTVSNTSLEAKQTYSQILLQKISHSGSKPFFDVCTHVEARNKDKL